ncbi:HSP70-domain-containing protein, partial [Hanseniaspora valbyensis NRRL Y-1626]
KLTLGIDLGTTNTLASYIPKGSKTPVILNQTKIPSVVAYLQKSFNNDSTNGDRNNILVGEKAINQSRVNSQNTFKAMKRIIGTTDPHGDAFKGFINQYTHHLNIKDTVKFDVGSGKEITAVDVAGQVLSEVRIQALNELEINESSKEKNKSFDVDAVITVPAYFNNLQRKATLKAATLAKINCLRIINEPTAAALSFGVLQQKDNRDGIFAVYDLGGGTFDISILELDGSVFEVRATSGDLQLGGEDLDYLLRTYVIDKFAKGNESLKKDMVSDENFMNELLKNCETCKIELSRVSSTTIAIPFAFKNSETGDMVNFKINIEEPELDKLAEPMVKKSLKIFRKCLKDAKIDKKDIKQILLVGGMTRMPFIRNSLSETFAKDSSSSSTIVNSTINPDDSVCLGASIQAGLLKGEIKDVLLLDVNPLSLGMETYGGVMSKMLVKNCNVPIEVKEQFTTGIDNQQIVKIVIYQGESNLCRDNVKLGELLLSGIPQLPKGVPKIEVSFKLDSNGILNVSAKE